MRVWDWDAGWDAGGVGRARWFLWWDVGWEMLSATGFAEGVGAGC